MRARHAADARFFRLATLPATSLQQQRSATGRTWEGTSPHLNRVVRGSVHELDSFGGRRQRQQRSPPSLPGLAEFRHQRGSTRGAEKRVLEFFGGEELADR